MGISVKWLIEPTIILLENWGTLESTDIKEEVMQLVQFLDKAPDKVHVIADTLRLEHVIIVNPLAMPEMRQFLRHRNRGWVIFVGSKHPLVNFWGQMLSRVGELPNRFVDSVDEATEFLQAMNKAQD